MWNSKITGSQLLWLQVLGFWVIDPVEKTLACGDTGVGAMANIADIVSEVKSFNINCA